MFGRRGLLARFLQLIKVIHEIGFPGWLEHNLDCCSSYWGVESNYEGGLAPVLPFLIGDDSYFLPALTSALTQLRSV